MRFRNGQWVKFRPTPECAGAHLSPEGLAVGIFQHAFYTPETNPGAHPIYEVNHVVPVLPDGHNIPLVIEGEPQFHNGAPRHVQLEADAVEDLQAANLETDFPPGRVRG